MINIGLGTTTMILSAWNLMHHKKIKDRATSWDIYSIPAERKKMNVGFSLTRKI